jgi:glycosyltransferase involved in cell wall biosynthesis
MKIVMLGPIYPYKGGIAQYSGAMCAALSKEHEVKAVSFSLQYPKALYKRPQKDEENTTFRFDPAVFPLNTVNPATWKETAKQIRKEHPDLLIVQWWHPWFAPCYDAVLKNIRKKSPETKIIFVCHNVLPHEGFPMKEQLTSKVLRRGDAYIVHSAQDAEDLKRLVPSPQFIHGVHPTYNQFKKKDLSKEESRKILGIPAEQEMLLFFGYIREYKGLKHLIRALPEIRAKRPRAHLFVVGDFWEKNKEEYEQLIRETGTEQAVTLVDGYLPDDEVEPYFAAADLCVLPYESATQSGVIQIAYSFGLAVVATAVGGLPEVVLDGETGFVVPPKEDKKLAETVVRFFEENRAEAFRERIKEEDSRYSWDRMTEHVDNLAAQLKEKHNG